MGNVTSTISPLATTVSNCIKNITRSGTTFTATRASGGTFTFTQQDNVGTTCYYKDLRATTGTSKYGQFYIGEVKYNSYCTKANLLAATVLASKDNHGGFVTVYATDSVRVHSDEPNCWFDIRILYK